MTWFYLIGRVLQKKNIWRINVEKSEKLVNQKEAKENYIFYAACQ